MRRRGERTEMAGSLGEAYGELRADYDAARSSRYRRNPTGIAYGGSGADYHLNEAALMRIIELSRAYDRNDCVVGQGVNRLVANVHPHTYPLDTKTGDQALDADLKARWDDWSTDPEQCDVMGENTFGSIAARSFRNMIIDGDLLHLYLQEGSVQCVEAHRVKTPTNTKRNVVLGVLLDERRRRLEYWVTKDEIEPTRSVRLVSDMRQYAVRDEYGDRNLSHVAWMKRFSQTRGVSALAPIANMVGMHDDIEFALLVKAQVSAVFAVLRERPDAKSIAVAPAQTGERTTETLSDGTTRTVDGVAPGMEITGAPGEVLKGFSPNIPNPEFFPHAMLILTFIAVNLDVPVQVLLLDPKETNFSGWRGAMDQARLRLRGWQQFIVETMYDRAYAFKLRQWAVEDRALAAALKRLGKRFYGHAFVPPYWAYIEPEKDANGDKIIVDEGLNSRRAVLARRGLNIEEVDRERVQDREALITRAIEAAERVNATHPGAGVTWRDFVGSDTGVKRSEVSGGAEKRGTTENTEGTE